MCRHAQYMLSQMASNGNHKCNHTGQEAKPAVGNLDEKELFQFQPLLGLSALDYWEAPMPGCNSYHTTPHGIV